MYAVIIRWKCSRIGVYNLGRQSYFIKKETEIKKGICEGASNGKIDQHLLSPGREQQNSNADEFGVGVGKN